MNVLWRIKFFFPDWIDLCEYMELFLVSLKSILIFVGFEVFTAMAMKNAVFWDVAQSAATYSSWFLARRFFYPEDRGVTFLQNVGSIHKTYRAPQPRRRHSSVLIFV
jgi:hypothetical protein